MAAVKKSYDTLEKEVQDNIAALSNKYVALMMEEPDDKDVEKIKEDKRQIQTRLNALKKDLKFIQSMKPKTDKKREKDLERQQKDIVKSLKHIQSSIGAIVKKIPK